MCNKVATPDEGNLRKYIKQQKANQSREFKIDTFEKFYHITAFTMPLLPFIGKDDPWSISKAMWKFIPEKATLDAYKKYDTCNARADEIFEKRTYKDYILPKRGLVVLDGFFEGQEQPDKTSQPFFIYPASGELLTLGCVYSDWVDAGGNPVRTFSIITTEANNLMAEIHNKKKRMPLIVPPDKHDWWLSNDLTKNDLIDYFVPYPDGYLAAHKVSRNLYKRGFDNNTPDAQKAIA